MRAIQPRRSPCANASARRLGVANSRTAHSISMQCGLMLRQAVGKVGCSVSLTVRKQRMRPRPDAIESAFLNLKHPFGLSLSVNDSS